MHLFRLNDSLTRQCLLNQTRYADDLRLVLVGAVGSSVAVLSVLQNLLIFYVFSTSRKLRRQNYANPVLLALFDIVVSLTYLFLASGHFFAYRMGSAEAARFWARHMRLAYCVQHVAVTISNFLLVVASLERFLANGPLCYEVKKRVLVFMVHHKYAVFTSIVVSALLFKATIYFENSTLELPHCGLMDSLVPVWLGSTHRPGELVDWRAVRFWVRRLFTIFLPFLLLAYCNVHIVLHLEVRRREAAGDSVMIHDGSNSNLNSQKSPTTMDDPKRPMHNYEPIPEPKRSQTTLAPPSPNTHHHYHHHVIVQIDEPQRAPVTAATQSPPLQLRRPPSFGEKRGVRVATRTLVMVVGCYLISNSMTTIINIWEYLDVRFLRYEHYYAYLIASDVAALLTVVGCALRLPIYVINDRRIRKAVARAFLRCRYFHLRFCRRQAGEDGTLRDMAAVDVDLEKWSLVLVSNSLRSNLTGMLSQVDWATFRGRKSFDQLAVLVQNRRRFLVQMTINLGACEELPPTPSSTPSTSSSLIASSCCKNDGLLVCGPGGLHAGGELGTYLTEIQEEEAEEEEMLLIAEQGGGEEIRSRIMHDGGSRGEGVSREPRATCIIGN